MRGVGLRGVVEGESGGVDPAAGFSKVRRASPFWCHCWRRAAASWSAEGTTGLVLKGVAFLLAARFCDVQHSFARDWLLGRSRAWDDSRFSRCDHGPVGLGCL